MAELLAAGDVPSGGWLRAAAARGWAGVKLVLLIAVLGANLGLGVGAGALALWRAGQHAMAAGAPPVWGRHQPV